MLRLLVWLIVGLLAWTFVRTLAGALLGTGSRPPRRRGAGGAGSERPGELLVRDRVCDTYLPRSRAIRVVDPDGGEHFFCSQACRERHGRSSP